MTACSATGPIPHWHHAILAYLGCHTVRMRTVQACAGVSLPPNHTACSSLTTLALVAFGLEEGHSGLVDGVVGRFMGIAKGREQL